MLEKQGMRDWCSELEEMGFENGDVVPIAHDSEPSTHPVLDELDPETKRAVELFGMISALEKGLDIARTAIQYILGNYSPVLPAALVEKAPDLPAVAQCIAEEQTWMLASDIFRRLLAQIPEDAPTPLRRQVDLFDTTFGLGINEGKASSEIAVQRYAISREAWEQAQDRLCKSLGIARPITRNSKRDTTKNKLRNYRHAKFGCSGA